MSDGKGFPESSFWPRTFKILFLFQHTYSSFRSHGLVHITQSPTGLTWNESALM